MSRHGQGALVGGRHQRRRARAPAAVGGQGQAQSAGGHGAILYHWIQSSTARTSAGQGSALAVLARAQAEGGAEAAGEVVGIMPAHRAADHATGSSVVSSSTAAFSARRRASQAIGDCPVWRLNRRTR